MLAVCISMFDRTELMMRSVEVCLRFVKKRWRKAAEQKLCSCLLCWTSPPLTRMGRVVELRCVRT